MLGIETSDKELHNLIFGIFSIQLEEDVVVYFLPRLNEELFPAKVRKKLLLTVSFKTVNKEAVRVGGWVNKAKKRQLRS